MATHDKLKKLEDFINLDDFQDNVAKNVTENEKNLAAAESQLQSMSELFSSLDLDVSSSSNYQQNDRLTQAEKDKVSRELEVFTQELRRELSALNKRTIAKGGATRFRFNQVKI